MDGKSGHGEPAPGREQLFDQWRGIHILKMSIRVNGLLPLGLSILKLADVFLWEDWSQVGSLCPMSLTLAGAAAVMVKKYFMMGSHLN